MEENNAVEQGEENVQPAGQGPPIQVGLHPLGGIALQVRDREGTTTEIRLNIQESWELVGHLGALNNMLVQAAYAQMAQQVEETNRLIVPRS